MQKYEDDWRWSGVDDSRDFLSYPEDSYFKGTSVLSRPWSKCDLKKKAIFKRLLNERSEFDHLAEIKPNKDH